MRHKPRKIHLSIPLKLVPYLIRETESRIHSLGYYGWDSWIPNQVWNDTSEARCFTDFMLVTIPERFSMTIILTCIERLFFLAPWGRG